MPLYEYRCNDCNETFEKLVGFSEANRNPVCPNCQGQQTQKKISRISVTNASNHSSAGASVSNCGSNGRFS